MIWCACASIRFSLSPKTNVNSMFDAFCLDCMQHKLLPRRAKLFFDAMVFSEDATCNQFGMSAQLSFLFCSPFAIYMVFDHSKYLLFQPYVHHAFLACPFFRSLIGFHNFTWKREQQCHSTIFTQVFASCVLNLLPMMEHLFFSPRSLLSLFFINVFLGTEKSTWKKRKEK